MVKLRAVRFEAALPSRAPTVPVITGLEKSRPLWSVQVPVERLVASVLSWKSSRSAARPAVFWPRRHCSPVYEITSAWIVDPVLLVNWAPMTGVRALLSRQPNARSEPLDTP